MKNFSFLAGVLIPLFFLLSFSEVSASEKIIRDYSAQLTPEEKQDINYIITTLSGRSTLGLLLYKKKLEEAGKRVDHLNPLSHLGYVFSNPELTAKAKKIDRVAWNRYVNGFKIPLHLAYKQGKLNQQVLEEFAKQININVHILEPYIQNQDWKGFVNAIRNHK